MRITGDGAGTITCWGTREADLLWHPWAGSAVDPYPYLVAACAQT